MDSQEERLLKEMIEASQSPNKRTKTPTEILAATPHQKGGLAQLAQAEQDALLLSSAGQSRPLRALTSRNDSEQPFVRMDSPEYELVRKQLVALYSSSPLYQQHAKATGDEMQYWSNFTAGGTVRAPKVPVGFSLEQLKTMSIMDIVEANRNAR